MQLLFDIYVKPVGEDRRFGLQCLQYSDDTEFLYISFPSAPKRAVETVNLCLEAVMG